MRLPLTVMNGKISRPSGTWAMPLRATQSGSRPVIGSAREGDRSLLRLHGAADRLQHRRLAGAVGAENGDDLALGLTSKLTPGDGR